jgi:hypothetical protein
LQDGTPLKFHSVGQDFFQGSHYDEYNYKWVSYKPGPVDPSVFDLPDICKNRPSNAQQQQQQQQEEEGGNGQQQGEKQLENDSGRHHHALAAIALLPGNHQEHAGEVLGV